MAKGPSVPGGGGSFGGSGGSVNGGGGSWGQPKKSLTPEQIKTLQAQGISPGEINAYVNGSASPNVTARANVILANGGVFKTPTGQAINNGTQSGILNSLPLIKGGLSAALGNIPGTIGAIGSGIGGVVAGVTGNPFMPGGYSSIFPKGVGLPPSVAAPTDQKRLGVAVKPNATRSGLQQNTRQAVKPVDPMAGYPDYPDLGGYSVPTISPQDFTEQARSLADNAFAPVQAMLDQSKTNIGVEGERSRKVVGGLYEKLVNDIATEAARQNSTYDKSKADAGQLGTDLSAQIGQNYSSGNQQTADLLQKIGAQQAAPEILQQGANDQAFAQGQANTGTAAMQNYYGQQQQGQSDYNGQLGNISRNQGVVAQSGILDQVRNMLAQVDQQKADTSSQAAQTGLQIGQQMTDRDLQAQQANAGYSMQGQEANNQLALGRYGAATDRWNTQNTLAQQQLSNQANAAQQEFDNNIALGKLGIDQATIQQKAGGSVPVPDGLAKQRTAYEAQSPGQGGAIFDAALAKLQDIDPNNQNKLGTYLQSVRDYANAHPPMNPDQAALIALDIYKQSYGNG